MIKKLILFSFLFISNCFADYQYYLSVGAIFRDEAPYLKEWIEYHRLIGVEHFYLCSHCSQDNYQEVLKPYIDQGIVELTEWTMNCNAVHGEFCYGLQPHWYTEVIDKSRGVSKWVALLDSDEFICPVQSNSVSEFLKDYEEFAGVSINWLFFGTSNIKKLSSDKLMIEQLTACADPYNTDGHSFLKMILQPEYTVKCAVAHIAGYLPGYYAVNPNKEHLTTPGRSKVVLDKIRINHYWTRDEDYFEQIKVPRQRQLYGPHHTAYQQRDVMNQTQDFVIQRFVPALRKRVGLD
jgi:hypothetical protein